MGGDPTASHSGGALAESSLRSDVSLFNDPLKLWFPVFVRCNLPFSSHRFLSSPYGGRPSGSTGINPEGNEKPVDSVRGHARLASDNAAALQRNVPAPRFCRPRLSQQGGSDPASLNSCACLPHGKSQTSKGSCVVLGRAQKASQEC